METHSRDFNPQEKINWESQDSHVLLNPHWPSEVLQDLKKLTDQFPLPAHIWIASSGSSSKDLRSTKLVALSKKAFLVSAKAVNEHLRSSSQDIWLNVLPDFHVGGLSIYARVFLSGAAVHSDLKAWNALQFFEKLQQTRASLVSLVPTQIFDLVNNNLQSPKSLRAVIVGGGHLSEDLYQKALDKGWPLLPSFGMTECCSQIATAEITAISKRDSRLKILSHIQAQTNSEGKLNLQSSALLTGYAQWNQNEASWIDPKVNGVLTTEDHVIIADDYLIPQGRSQHYVKILGEGVSLFRLQEIFEETIRQEDPENWQAYALTAVQHPRKENEIAVVHASHRLEKLEKIIRVFNSKVLGIEKIERSFSITEIPRTSLGKIKFGELHQELKKFF